MSAAGALAAGVLLVALVVALGPLGAFVSLSFFLLSFLFFSSSFLGSAVGWAWP
jgi:hypothetical protein